MKQARTILALFAAAMISPVTAIAQDEDIVADASENIAVASHKSPDELRRDLWQAEREFYALYNDLNDDNRYDVRCTKEAPTGSVIKLQTCRPKFLDKALREGRISNPENLGSNTQVVNKMETFRKNLEALVATNPELRSAAATLNLAYDQLAASS